ncbi:MAG: hypothetical protein QW840_04880 [Candidatus Bathyarchaeia archaeon]
MGFESYVGEKLWPVLVETVHAMVMYPSHKAYTREVVLAENPKVTPEELAVRLRIPFGEALVILFELSNEQKPAS